MSMRIDDFKTALAQGGARSNLFRATVFWPNANIRGDADQNIGGDALHSFMFRSAALPSSAIAPIPVPFRGRTLKVTGDRTFEDWTVDVINDNNFSVRDAFERWHDAINGNVSNVSGRGVNAANFNSYVGNIEVDQLGRNGQPIKRYRLIGAWPTEVTRIELSADMSDIENFQVVFTYQWFETNTTLDPSTGNFVTPPANG
jgi:hypothetical protein